MPPECGICHQYHVPSCAALDRLWDALEAAPDAECDPSPLTGAPGLADRYLLAAFEQIATLEAMWALPCREAR